MVHESWFVARCAPRLVWRHCTHDIPPPLSWFPWPCPIPPASATSITIRCAKRTIQSSVAHVQPLEKGTRWARDRRDSHPILDLVIRFVKSYAKCTTHTRRGLFRSVQLSATTFVFARRGGAFTVSAHAAVVPASSFPWSWAVLKTPQK